MGLEFHSPHMVVALEEANLGALLLLWQQRPAVLSPVVGHHLQAHTMSARRASFP